MGLFDLDKDDIESTLTLARERQARIDEVDVQIKAAYQQGYSVDVDRLLDERRRLVRLLYQGWSHAGLGRAASPSDRSSGS